MKKVIPENVFTGKAIVDLKGRDKQNLLLENFPDDQKPSEQEILFVQGAANHGVEPITFRINTPFLRFSNSHIEHSVTSERSFHAPRFLKAKSLGEIIPFSLKHFRCGLERYQSLFKALSFGYVPEVVDRLIVDYSDGSLAVELQASNLLSPTTPPFFGVLEIESFLNLLETL